MYQGWRVSLQSLETPWAFSLSSVILSRYHQVAAIVGLQHRPSLSASIPCPQGDRAWMAPCAAHHRAGGLRGPEPCQAVVQEEEALPQEGLQADVLQTATFLLYLCPNPAQQLCLNNCPYGRWSHPGTRVSHWNTTSWRHWTDSCSFDHLCTQREVNILITFVKLTYGCSDEVAGFCEVQLG